MSESACVCLSLAESKEWKWREGNRELLITRKQASLGKHEHEQSFISTNLLVWKTHKKCINILNEMHKQTSHYVCMICIHVFLALIFSASPFIVSSLTFSCFLFTSLTTRWMCVQCINTDAEFETQFHQTISQRPLFFCNSAYGDEIKSSRAAL